MKSILRRTTALVLCLLLLGSTAFASDALGGKIYSYTLDICDQTTLTREVMWSASKSDLRTENYVTYKPSSSVSPVVSYGTSVLDKQTGLLHAKALEKNGKRVLSGINGDYFVMATGDPWALWSPMGSCAPPLLILTLWGSAQMAPLSSDPQPGS